MMKIGPDAPPKCKTADARYSGYRLFVELCRDVPENFNTLTQALMKHIHSNNNHSNWQITPGLKEKSNHGYVGLENLGATCYMNSLVQQLYLIPELRYSLLSVKDQSADKEDSPLYQMQYMFSYLQETLKGFYSTHSFCASYKDFDDNPVNPLQQMDANEFFNTLFDKLEGLLAPTKKPNVLKELFGGVLAHQFISKDCDHYSENTEAFYTIGVEIKNKKDILSSFDLFTEGELLTGDSKYHCEQCGKHVDALKRCCLKYLPKTIFIQLKRFEFDLNTMRNLKINDEFVFLLSFSFSFSFSLSILFPFLLASFLPFLPFSIPFLFPFLLASFLFLFPSFSFRPSSPFLSSLFSFFPPSSPSLPPFPPFFYLNSKH